MGWLRRELEYFFGALRFFTRLPVPAWVGHSADGLNRAARYFPAVGLLVGAIGALAFFLAALVWPKPLAVVAAMAATIYSTGAFHEDGLSDMVDGFGGGWSKEQVLTIMKDSRVGSYGVVAIILVLLGKFLALVELPAAAVPAALVAGHGVSRGCATVLLKSLDYVREDLQAKAKPLATRIAWGELALAAAFALGGVALLGLFLPLAALLTGLLLAALTTLWMARLMLRRLGGYTGDCLGATQQGSELAFYLGLLWTFS
ncbi:MAG TPA: adenosylcobinamide-GDP ribazoletransferase [Azospira sp.]|nr:adenosylcobinamide-GDP ribazoletransferase [Azospira sp.]